MVKEDLENSMVRRPVDILLVEDDEADVKITLRAFKKAKLKNSIVVLRDGQEAIDYVNRCGEYSEEKK